MPKLYEVAFDGFLVIEASGEEEAAKQAIRWQEAVKRNDPNLADIADDCKLVTFSASWGNIEQTTEALVVQQHA